MEKMIGILLLGFFLALLLFLLIFFMGNGALNRYFESLCIEEMFLRKP